VILFTSQDVKDAIFQKLIPIEDWSKIAPGTKIVHEDVLHPIYFDFFLEYIEQESEQCLIKYRNAVKLGSENTWVHPCDHWYLWDEETVKQFSESQALVELEKFINQNF
jgi:hypothetical protein